jgi:cellulose synthase/poly-beta-1,6-N-acetylglucosamine synthase-like glycosyltransferase
MDLSLIICTRNRCHQLARCLQSVDRIECERQWELIIVDNGSSDGTASVIHEFIRTTSVSAVSVSEPKAGKSNALNAALKIARGEVLAFTDDDCYPASDFLNQVWQAFKDPSVGYIGGRILLHDPADYPVTVNESTIPRSWPGRKFNPVGNVSGANMAFRRQVLLDIGGFDPLLGPGSLFNAVAEDADVTAGASAIGWNGQYCPEVVVRHHHGRKAADVPSLMKSYAIGRGAFNTKLLLRGEFGWFARAVYLLPLHVKLYGRSVILWEAVGAAKYAYAYFSRALRSGRNQTAS